MEKDILDYLNLIGYNGIATKEDVMSKAVKGGPKSVEFTQLVEWICNELRGIYNLEEQVHAIASEKESDKFLTEVANFVQELGCSHVQLFEGPLSERLNTKKSKLLLLEFLLSELMAAQMFVFKKGRGYEEADVKVQLQEESETAANLKTLFETFGLCKPMENISEASLFSKLEDRLKESLNIAAPELVGKPLFTAKLTDKQWRTLDEVQRELNDEYCMRREMLIKRLDVTIQSFQLCNKPQSNIDQMLSTFSTHRSNMKAKPDIEVEDLLAARDDLAILEKASSASVRKNTQTSINKVIIGRVPDRGGRPSEQEAPPPEMPSWQKERATGGGGGRGGGGGHGGGQGGGRGGGRVQGNWNRDNRSGHHDNRGYQESRSSHQDNRGGYTDNRGYQDNRGGYTDNRGYQDNRGGYADNRGYQENRGGYRGRHHGGGGRRDGGRRNY